MLPDTKNYKFDEVVKSNALRILMDYSAATGKKWTAILNEIMTFTNADSSRKHPLVTRQDLESWATGRSQLGDQKFRWIYDFLIHPDTLSRPEFSEAKELLNPRYRLFRVGRVLGELYGRSGIMRDRRDTSKRAVRERYERGPSQYDGLFVGDFNKQTDGVALHLKKIKGESFFIAHLLYSLDIPEAGEDDWLVRRLSGFATHGVTGFLLHLCDPISPSHWYVMNLSADGKLLREGETPGLILIEFELVPRILKYIVNKLYDGKKEIFSVEESIINLRPSSSRKYYNIFANIEWDVPL